MNTEQKLRQALQFVVIVEASTRAGADENRATALAMAAATAQQALAAEPEQAEPVAWIDEKGRIYLHCPNIAERANNLQLSEPLYRRLPKPTPLVRLTDDKVYDLWMNADGLYEPFASAIMAAMSKKNGGV